MWIMSSKSKLRDWEKLGFSFLFPANTHTHKHSTHIRQKYNIHTYTKMYSENIEYIELCLYKWTQHKRTHNNWKSGKTFNKTYYHTYYLWKEDRRHNGDKNILAYTGWLFLYAPCLLFLRAQNSKKNSSRSYKLVLALLTLRNYPKCSKSLLILWCRLCYSIFKWNAIFIFALQIELDTQLGLLWVLDDSG